MRGSVSAQQSTSIIFDCNLLPKKFQPTPSHLPPKCMYTCVFTFMHRWVCVQMVAPPPHGVVWVWFGCVNLYCGFHPSPDPTATLGQTPPPQASQSEGTPSPAHRRSTARLSCGMALCGPPNSLRTLSLPLLLNHVCDLGSWIVSPLSVGRPF